MALSVFSISARLLFRRMGILLAGNVLWLLLTVPIVTWPAATAGLFYLCHRVVLEERALDPYYARVSDFWTGFRRYWKKSIALMILDLVVFVLLGSALWFYYTSEIEALRWLIGPVALAGLAWLGAQLYLVPQLIVAPAESVFRIAWTALLTAISFPVYTLTLLALLLVLTAICLALLGPVLLLLFAMLAITQTVALRMIRVQLGQIPPVQVGEQENETPLRRR
jgi:hypothetical protein